MFGLLSDLIANSNLAVLSACVFELQESRPKLSISKLILSAFAIKVFMIIVEGSILKY